jgi:hypothetical protein
MSVSHHNTLHLLVIMSSATIIPEVNAHQTETAEHYWLWGCLMSRHVVIQDMCGADVMPDAAGLWWCPARFFGHLPVSQNLERDVYEYYYYAWASCQQVDCGNSCISVGSDQCQQCPTLAVGSGQLSPPARWLQSGAFIMCFLHQSAVQPGAVLQELCRGDLFAGTNAGPLQHLTT